MPNHVTTRCVVTGPADEIAKFRSMMFVEKENSIVETGFASWYPWSIHHWGTKWNSYEFELVNDEPLEFTFDTAWSFPGPIFNILAETFPTLHFECSSYDEGSNFAGDGFFNSPEGGQPFTYYDHNSIPDGLYKKVYGTDEPNYEE